MEYEPPIPATPRARRRGHELRDVAIRPILYLPDRPDRLRRRAPGAS